MKSGTKKLLIPTSVLIRDLGNLHKGVINPDELKTFNAYHYFMDLEEVSKAVGLTPITCTKLLLSCTRKIEFLRELAKSRARYKRAKLTKAQFLNAPLIMHGLPTQVFHALLDLGAFCMGDVLELGMRKLRLKRGIGPNRLKEITNLVKRYGCVGRCGLSE